MPLDDAYTKALLHMNGVDTSTTFTDESGKTWTTSNHAQIDTAQSKFGGASGLFDGVDDSITTPDHADFSLGTNDFTIDTQFRTGVLPSGVNYNVFSQYTAWQNQWHFALADAGGGTQKLFTWAYSGGGELWSLVSSAFTLSLNTWCHLVFARSGNTLYYFVNGVGKGTSAFNYTVPDLADVICIGARYTVDSCLNGWLDEFRFSNGIARWTTDFTPPTSEYGRPTNSYLKGRPRNRYDLTGVSLG